VQLVGPVAPGWRDDGAAQEPQQLWDGDGDQLSQLWAGVVLALHGGDREVDVGEQADGGPAVPGLPAGDLPGVQAGGLLAELVIFFDGLIAKWQVLLCAAGAAELDLVEPSAAVAGICSPR
jgi:hypothetical protein